MSLSSHSPALVLTT